MSMTSSRVSSGKRRDYVRIANDYARKVVAGRIDACKWVKLACERHLTDLKRKGRDWKFKFDSPTAARVCGIIELMPYTKGKWAKPIRGQRERPRIKLEPWQVFITCVLFGWVEKTRQPDGRYLRRFTLAYLNIPRKNGKSEWVAAVGNYMLAADGELGAEVYCGATTESQAWAVFRPAKAMMDLSPRFRSFTGVETAAESIYVKKTSSRFQPIIGNPGDGDSPHCAIIDEYHEHKTDALFDTMRTGMGAREQPMTIVITTAGSDVSSPCFALQQDVQKILDRTVADERTFGIIYTIDKGDDWSTIAALKKANPNFGVSVLQDYIESQRQAALRSPRKQNIYKTKHLNVWVHARNPWMNMRAWHACEDRSLRDDMFLGETAFGGMDLSSKLDITDLAYIFRRMQGGKPHIYLFVRSYVPEAQVKLPENEHYQEWVNSGHLIETDGNVIDYELLQDDILDLSQRFQFAQWGYDPWQAAQLAQKLQAEGLPMVEVPMNVMRLSDPMKEFEALVLDGRLHHDGNPVLTWMISNVTAKPDAKENVYPRKDKPENKIDAAVAAIVALSRALDAPEETESVYETRGMLRV